MAKQKPKKEIKEKPEGYIFGRPTVYKPEFCEQAIEIMSTGDGFEEVAQCLGVRRSTINEWMKKHPDFSDAIEFGRELSECWWRSQGKNSLYNREFNTKNWDINMMNRFQWSKKTETSGNITVSHEMLLKELE